MDFGALGFDGLVGSDSGAPSSQVSLAPEVLPKIFGSRQAKQEGSGTGEDDRGGSKLPRTSDFAVARTMPLHQASPLLRSNSLVSADAAAAHQEQMLSFSSSKSDVTFLSRATTGMLDRSSQIAGYPYYQTPSAAAYARTAPGYGSGSINPSMHVPFTGARGPFTPSQWIELEQQALIFKYINAKVSVPSNLLNPLKKSLNPYGLSFSSAGSYVSSYGWGNFHLGYSGSTDPEPGRCRRTDGKKWRCSRDAVPDQKYCERHINRGRHRSRKPVEGQTGHAAPGTTSSNVVLTTSSMSTSVITSGSSSNSLTIAQHQLKTLQPAGAANPSANALVNRVQDPRSLSMMSSTINLKSNESTFAIPKPDIPFEESSQSVFGLVHSDSLLNPSERSSFLDSKSYGGSFLDFNEQETQDQRNIRQFIDEWPDESNRSAITWHDELKSDWTQLSMSIPMSSEFSSSSSSPAHEKLAVSPLRLSREFDPVQMGSGVNNDLPESMQKQTNWIPVTWGSSMGGPLGEALTNPTNIVGTFKNQSSLNLLTEGWDASPQLGSSPTGVLQKSTFRSLSNSSSGSSPITENKKTHEGASLCDDMLGSTHVSSSLSKKQQQ